MVGGRGWAPATRLASPLTGRRVDRQPSVGGTGQHVGRSSTVPLLLIVVAWNVVAVGGLTAAAVEGVDVAGPFHGRCRSSSDSIAGSLVAAST